MQRSDTLDTVNSIARAQENYAEGLSLIGHALIALVQRTFTRGATKRHSAR
jgi:hypothetical protein